MKRPPLRSRQVSPGTSERWAGGPLAVPGFRILRLTTTLCAARTGELAVAVTARVAACEDVAGTVILTLEGDPPPDRAMREALYTLHDRLRASGVRLRLVVSAGEVRRYLEQAGPDSAPGHLAVHPTMRSAVLASYAELSGPGLVTAGVRAALVAPSEPLVLPDETASTTHPPEGIPAAVGLVSMVVRTAGR